MKRMRYVAGFVGLALACSQAHAADPVYTPMPSQGGDSSYSSHSPGMSYTPIMAVAQAPRPATPQAPVAPAPAGAADQNAQPQSDAFAQGPPSGTETSGGFNPQMLGDSLIYVLNSNFRTSSSSSSSSSFSNSSSSSSGLRVPLPSFGDFKVADNGDVAPEDRVFVNYNAFSRVGSSLIGSSANFHVNNETIGFEKACLDGLVSFELRAPFYQLNGDDMNSCNFGDLTLIGKIGMVGEGRNAISGGLAVTVPTGPNFTAVNGTSVNPTIIQPFIGYCCNADGAYIQGFSSYAIATDNNFGSIWFNDLAIGYIMRSHSCDSMITGIVPTMEAHLDTPVGHIGSISDVVGIPDQLVLTGGAHLLFGKSSRLSAGLDVPVTGPRVYATEWVVQLNIGF
jgi:hypothetical protein